MPFAIGIGGIIVALVFLTFAVYKGWSILYSSILSVIIIALTNGLHLYEALTVTYVSSFTSYFYQQQQHPSPKTPILF